MEQAAHWRTWFSPSEQARFDGFGSEPRRRSFVAGRWLLRGLVAQRLGLLPGALDLAIEIDANGRSRVRGDSSLHVSISHSGDRVAAVVAGAPVGLDIEDLRRPRDFLALAEMVHTPPQGRRLCGLPSQGQAQQFYTWWTLKEAWLKSRGLGLDLALMRRLDFTPTERGDAACAVLPVSGLALALQGPRLGIDSLPVQLAGEALQWQILESRLDP